MFVRRASLVSTFLRLGSCSRAGRPCQVISPLWCLGKILTVMWHDVFQRAIHYRTPDYPLVSNRLCASDNLLPPLRTRLQCDTSPDAPVMNYNFSLSRTSLLCVLVGEKVGMTALDVGADHSLISRRPTTTTVGCKYFPYAVKHIPFVEWHSVLKIRICSTISWSFVLEFYSETQHRSLDKCIIIAHQSTYFLFL